MLFVADSAANGDPFSGGGASAFQPDGNPAGAAGAPRRRGDGTAPALGEGRRLPRGETGHRLQVRKEASSKYPSFSRYSRATTSTLCTSSNANCVFFLKIFLKKIVLIAILRLLNLLLQSYRIKNFFKLII